MTISVKEFLRMSDAKIDKLAGGARCSDCGVRLSTTVTERQNTSRGEVCGDCYFEGLGRHVEKHPICIPRMHRGH